MAGRRLLAVVLGASLVLAACEPPPAPTPGGPSGTPAAALGSDAPPVGTPEPTASPAVGGPASPAPEPTATPGPDVAAAFQAVMADPVFSASIALTGRTRVGSTASASVGRLEVALPSSALELTTTREGSAATLATRLVDGIRYTQRGERWFDQGSARADDLLASLLAIDGTITDAGVETLHGRRLTHLVIEPSGGVRGALGVPSSGASRVVPEVDAWVEEDGVPVLMRLAAAWSQRSGKRTVAATASLDLAFTGVGGPVAIEAPPDPWAWSVSEQYGYRMGRPADWRFEPGTGKALDAYWGFDGDAVFAWRFRSYGFSLKEVAATLAKDPDQITGVKDAKLTAGRAGRLGSLPARIVEFTGTVEGEPYWWLATYAVKGRWVYWVEYRTTGPTTAEDRALAAGFRETHEVR